MKNGLKNKRILITCGPTWSAIDEVRVLSNTSTGQMGHLLAEAFKKTQANVTILEGPVMHSLKGGDIRVRKFNYYHELISLLKKELQKNFDIIIHAAAVSDYEIKHKVNSKIPSGKKEFRLTLVPTKKIINTIKRMAPQALLIGFKLETNMSAKLAHMKAKKLIQDAKCDLVVANSVNNGYCGFVLNNKAQVIAQAKSRKGLSKILVNRVADIL